MIWPSEFHYLMAWYIMGYEDPEVSLSLENVLNHESQKGTHFTLKWSYLTVFDHMGGPIDLA